MNFIDEKDLLSKIKELKPLPSVAMKVISMMDNPDSSINDLKKEILLDPALTANILKVCNSSYYGFSRQITNLTRAITLIGIEPVRNIILSATFRGSFNDEVTAYALEKGELSKHSIGVALACELVAEKVPSAEKETAFIAGLLHDIGKIILDQYSQDKFWEIIEKVQNECRNFCEVEKEIFGYDHADIGAKIAEEWQLPKPLVEAIQFHHHPSDCVSGSIIVPIVHLGNVITLMLGIGCGADGLTSSLDENALTELDLDQKDFEILIAQMPERLKLLDELDSPN